MEGGLQGAPLKISIFFRGYIFWGALKPPQKWKIPEKNYWTLFITLKGILFRGGMIIFSRNKFLRDFLVRANGAALQCEGVTSRVSLAVLAVGVWLSWAQPACGAAASAGVSARTPSCVSPRNNMMDTESRTYTSPANRLPRPLPRHLPFDSVQTANCPCPPLMCPGH